MIHICYAYIRHSKALDHVGIKIDSQYDYHYDDDSRVLTISHNKRYPRNFWGDGVYSLAAIIGNNGAGKSTAMEFLLGTLLEGANRREVDGVLVYENDGKLEIWGSNVKVKTKLPHEFIREIPKISCFYYCGHFMPYVNYNDMRFSELAGGYNASDGWLLLKDLQSYTNVDSMYMDKPLAWHLNVFVARNNSRICRMLADKKVRDTFKSFILPKYILFGVNQSGYYALLAKKRTGKVKQEIPERRVVNADSKNRLLESFIYYDFLNLANEGFGLNSDEVLKALDVWQTNQSVNDEVLFRLKSFYENGNWSQELTAYLKSIYVIMTRVVTLCGFYDDNVSQLFYLHSEKDSNKLSILVHEVLNEWPFLTASYFDLYYSQELGGETILSSGEQNLLDLFSRLYDALVISPSKFANVDSKRLVLLDEAEIGFHPDWQRKYIDLILQFLQTLVLVRPGEGFQVLISTHSPILLSDIPSCCVNYLERDSNGIVHVLEREDVKETFATNVFEQYRDSFFMRDGLIGEFARKKLIAVQDTIEEAGITDETLKVIGMIGDVRIKEYLMQKIAKQDIDAEIDYYKGKIEELKRRKTQNNE